MGTEFTPDLAICDLDALGEGAKVVTAITSPFKADILPRGFGEGVHDLRGNGLAAGVLKHGLGALGVGLRLIADGLEAVDAILERRVVQVGDARFDGVIEALEAGFRFRRALVQFGDVVALTFGSLLPPIEHGGEDRLQPLRLEETVFEMAGDETASKVSRSMSGGTGTTTISLTGFSSVDLARLLNSCSPI